MITTINEWKRLNESQGSDFQDIINFVSTFPGTTLEHDGDDSDMREIQFTTREHGDVGDETPGQEDLDDAYRLRKEIKSKWPAYEVDVEEVDEWVHLIVRLPHVDPVTYIFIRHSDEIGSRQSTGFSEFYDENRVDELKERISKFIPISKERADEIIAQLDTMDINQSIPNYFRKGAVVSIIKKGEPGNQWGSNFSVVKTNQRWY